MCLCVYVCASMCASAHMCGRTCRPQLDVVCLPSSLTLFSEAGALTESAVSLTDQLNWPASSFRDWPVSCPCSRLQVYTTMLSLSVSAEDLSSVPRLTQQAFS